MLIWLKFIAALLQPPGLNLLLCLIGIYYWLKSSNVIAAFFLTVSAILLYLFSTPYVSNALLTRLESNYQSAKFEEVINHKEPTAIVVLSSIDPVYGLIFHQYASQLAKVTNLPILVSGNHILPEDNNKINEAEAMAKSLATDFGITGAIWVESDSRSTKESAKLSKQVLDKNSIKNIFLITNAWHMSSAMQLFKSQGIEVVPAPILTAISQPTSTLRNFTPSAACLVSSGFFFKEHLEKFASKVSDITSNS